MVQDLIYIKRVFYGQEKARASTRHFLSLNLLGPMPVSQAQSMWERAGSGRRSDDDGITFDINVD
ncbi:hypothetical protein HK44_000480 [Pseudomonas fluorescens HK44]|uniref:Uncharacterized protein n=1 Tax=Pseudomonas fluorescens HK44 TaxID=1042209 RepID=A0A010SP16_PSEFL|nr:hypothetical protein HK44_000480 [Pseudomonas fluorescens HK44]